MQVTVRLHGNLKRYYRGLGTDARLELPDGATVRALIDRVGIPEAEWWMVVVDDRVVEEGAPLHEGALVEVMEPVAGGDR